MASPANKKFTINIPHDINAPDGLQSARRYDREGGGFSLIFTLPFKVEDVYRELVAEKQLGVDHKNIQIELSDAGAAVAAQLNKQLNVTASASEAADIKKWSESPSGRHGVLYVGVERTVTFPDGRVVSKLVELEENKKIKWRQQVTEREVNMLGKPKNGGQPSPTADVAEDDLPTVRIELDPMANGTSVRMTYDFLVIQNKTTGHVLEGDEMSKLLSQATQGWSSDMKRRGYAPLTSDTDGGVTSLDMTPRSAVVRSTKFLQADAEEEARMKGLLAAGK